MPVNINFGSGGGNSGGEEYANLEGRIDDLKERADEHDEKIGEHEERIDELEESILKPYKPTALAPADGAADSALYVRLKLSEYGHPLGIPIGGAHWQISADSGFAELVYDVRQVTASDSVVVTTDSDTAETYLQQGTEYFWRGRYFDLRENESDWSETRSFATAVDAGTDAIIQPDIMNPVNGGHTGESKIFVQLTQPVTIGQVAPDKADFQLSMTPDFADGDILLDKQNVEHTTLIIDDTVNLRDVSAPVYMRARQKDSVRGIVSPYSPVPTVWIQRAFRDLVVGMEHYITGNSSFVRPIDKSGNPVSIGNSYWNDHPIWGGMTPVEYTSGNGNLYHCTNMPGFWHKADTIKDGDTTRHRIWISPTQVDDSWYIHPAFVKSANGLLVSRYLVADGIEGDGAGIVYQRYGNVAAAWETVLNTINNGNDEAEFFNFHIRSALNIMFLIEKGKVGFTNGVDTLYRGIQFNLNQGSATGCAYEKGISISKVNLGVISTPTALFTAVKIGLPHNSNSLMDIGTVNTVLYGGNYYVDSIKTGFNEILNAYMEIYYIPDGLSPDANIVNKYYSHYSNALQTMTNEIKNSNLLGMCPEFGATGYPSARLIIPR